MKLPRRVGRVARRLRRERGESIEEVARRAGMSPIQLSRIERLVSSPTEEKIAGLAAALDVSVARMFDDGPSPAADTAAPGWSLMVETERLRSRLNDSAIRLEQRRRVDAAAVKFLLDLRLSLGQPLFHAELRQVWQTHERSEDRLAAGRRLFERHRPPMPGAALIFPQFRYTLEYREDGCCDCWYEFSLANIGLAPILHYDHAAGDCPPMTEEEIGLRITHRNGTPAAEVEWRPREGKTTQWRAKLLRPLLPGERRQLVEHWVWRYAPPLALIRNNSDLFAVRAFIGELEIVIGYPTGYVMEFNTAWVREGDGSLRTVEIQLTGADRPVLRLHEELPSFDGSDQLASYSVFQKVAKSGTDTDRPAMATRSVIGNTN